MTPSEKISVPADKATYLVTLYGKALDAAVPQPILGDRFAAEALARIDHDFKSLKMPDGGEITLPMRALNFDRWTRDFLAANPACTVLHLGCGLDTRVQRIDPGPSVRWYDIDLPEVIALRRQLYPARPGYQTLASSVTDAAWLEEIPGDLPVFVVAEGLFMYVPQPEAAALFQRIAAKFPSGELAFDGYSGWMVRLVSRLAAVRGAKVELVWGIDDPRDLEASAPALELVQDLAFLAQPELLARLSTTALKRAMYPLLLRFAFYRDLIRHLRFRFPAQRPHPASIRPAP